MEKTVVMNDGDWLLGCQVKENLHSFLTAVGLRTRVGSEWPTGQIQL